jgi:hypothetical protein
MFRTTRALGLPRVTKKNAENGPENTAGQTTNKAFAAVASHAASTMQKRDAVYQLHRMPLH